MPRWTKFSVDTSASRTGSDRARVSSAGLGRRLLAGGVLVAASLSLAPAALAQYCAAGSTTCTQDLADERIAEVIFGTIDNVSGIGNGPAGCYSDFTSISATILTGTTYTITVNNATGYTGDQATVWIDWNQDSTFGDLSSGEQVSLTANATFTQFTGTITVPADATLGQTRMRIRVQYDDAPSPCDNAEYGEVEDYSVNVVTPNTGACCAASGACAQVTAGACVSGFQGLNTTCLPGNPCGGACCDASGGCTVTIAGACAAASVFVNQGACNAAACHYCIAGSAACGTVNNDERISHVTCAGIDNDSGVGAGPASCYTDFTTMSATMTPGQSYPITVTNAGAYTLDQAAAWVDWNHDFAFGDAASGERVTLTSNGTGAMFTGSIAVPAGTLPGSYRMRIRVSYNTDPSRCGSEDYGEVEDYTIIIPTTGTCCVGTACTPSTLATCVGGVYADGGSCTPSPCVLPAVCCRGSTCNATFTSSADCTNSLVAGQLAGAAYITAPGCNSAGNTASPCCYADYNKTNGVGIPDIFDFLNDWLAGSPFANIGGDGVHGSLNVSNIFDFLSAWFVGGC